MNNNIYNLVQNLVNLNDRIINDKNFIKCESRRFNIDIYIKPIINLNKCCAVVKHINGSSYQCTRANKFNNLCGLHHDRKNNFKIIENILIKRLVINTEEFITKKKETLYQFTYNYLTYYYNIKQDNVYVLKDNKKSLLEIYEENHPQPYNELFNKQPDSFRLLNLDERNKIVIAI